MDCRWRSEEKSKQQLDLHHTMTATITKENTLHTMDDTLRKEFILHHFLLSAFIGRSGCRHALPNHKFGIYPQADRTYIEEAP